MNTDQHHQPIDVGDVLVVIRSGQLRMCQIASFSPCGYPMVKFWTMARDKFIAPIYQLQTSKFIKINYKSKLQQHEIQGHNSTEVQSSPSGTCPSDIV